MDYILKLVVLQNNPDLLIHAARIEVGLVKNLTGEKIVVQLDSSEIPVGFKKADTKAYGYYVETVVLEHNIYNINKPYFTEYGWMQARSEKPTVLVPIGE